MNLQYINSSRFLTFDIIHGGEFPGRPSALRSLHMVCSSPDSVSRGKTDTKSAACARGVARTSDSALSEEKRQANLWRSALAWLGHLVAEAGAHAKPHENRKTCIKRQTLTGLLGWQKERGPMCWSQSNTSTPKRYNLLKFIQIILAISFLEYKIFPSGK